MNESLCVCTHEADGDKRFREDPPQGTTPPASHTWFTDTRCIRFHGNPSSPSRISELNLPLPTPPAKHTHVHAHTQMSIYCYFPYTKTANVFTFKAIVKVVASRYRDIKCMPKCTVDSCKKKITKSHLWKQPFLIHWFHRHAWKHNMGYRIHHFKIKNLTSHGIIQKVYLLGTHQMILWSRYYN